MATNLAKPCGHRLYSYQFQKINLVAKKLKIKPAEALRRMIDEYQHEEAVSHAKLY